MHSLSLLLVSALVYSSPVVGAPAQSYCQAVNNVVAILNAPPFKATATPFCSSFLHYPVTATATSTQTVTAVQTQVTTLPDATETTTVPVTNVNSVTTTITTYEPDPTVSTTVTVTAATRTVYQKRDLEGRALPPALAQFASTKISSACSCIVTPTTTTVTATATATAAATVLQTAGPQTTVVVTYTTTVEVTSPATAVATLGPTSTVTTAVTTTVTPILVKPKICNARGLPGARAFNYDANFNTNQAACIASCKPDNRCLATGFYIVTDPSTGSQTGTCRKYDKSVTDSADLGSGYYNFNDKAC